MRASSRGPCTGPAPLINFSYDYSYRYRVSKPKPLLPMGANIGVSCHKCFCIETCFAFLACCCSVCHAFAVCHKIWPYRRHALAAILRKT